MEKESSIMVIGGGIAGIQASLDLANLGFHVDLIEKEPCIGGRMAQLDKTFPTNDCSICILSPKLSDCYRHPNIKLHTLSEVQSVSKKEKCYSVEVKKKARFVKEDACINCGLCIEKCPTKVNDKFDMYLRKRKAIYLYYLQGVPAVMAIDKEHCLYLSNLDKGKDICRQCENVCPKEAIDFSQEDQISTFNPNAIILATGFRQFNPSNIPQYKYAEFRNVITGLEYERLICASGPTNGHLERLSDKKPPKKIAFIQCVGSRDIKNQKYCSSVCCTYSTKEAILANEHDSEIQSFIFYIDIRAAGKGFQKYIERAKQEYQVNYVKGIVSEIKIDENENPILYYENIASSELCTMTVDLVVLASAMIPSDNIEYLAESMGIELDEFNFIKTVPSEPIKTTRKGIFVCGACKEPMDIPSSVTEASAAAAQAAQYASQNKGD
ncbi:MAG: NAD(P)-binding protein [Candidatus Lokiarchaeota archaeon]|nr:NAD(P)-binding protein [Candidatus Lokiarchaeota archaeon]